MTAAPGPRDLTSGNRTTAEAVRTARWDSKRTMTPFNPAATRSRNDRPTFRGWCLSLCLLCVSGVRLPAAGTEASASPSPYSEGTPSSPDGTGRFYRGREIARVMGHQGAGWLERPEREREEHSDQAIAALGLKPGMTVADLGAGTGYYSRRMAREVGETGRVYAVDIQPEMLELLRENADAAGLTNIVTVLATGKNPRLPENAIDLVIMVDVYHELASPDEVMKALLTSLKPGGRVAFLEYRAEDPNVPIKPLHKMTEAQVRREAEAHGLEWIGTVRSLPWQHLIFFRKPVPPKP